MEEIIKSIVENVVKSDELNKVKEFNSSELKNEKIIEPDLELAKSGSLESLILANQEKNLDLNNLNFPTISECDKTRIREETGWSKEIIDCIKNMEQYEIYKDAGLEEKEINGRKCVVKKDLDLDYIDEKTGLSNKERMERGMAPIDEKTGEKIELHHMDQKFDSPFVELTENSEHGGKNHKILHDNNIESWRRDPELKKQYNNIQRPEHWRSRLAILES